MLYNYTYPIKHRNSHSQVDSKRKHRKYLHDCSLPMDLGDRNGIRLDDCILSSETLVNSTYLSRSSSTSNFNDNDMDGFATNSISSLNSQLLRTERNDPATVANNSHSYSAPPQNSSRSHLSGQHDIIRYRNAEPSTARKINCFRNNIDSALRRDDNRRKYELSKEATHNHNHILHSVLDTSDVDDEEYDADADDDDDEIVKNTNGKANNNHRDNMDCLQWELDEIEQFEAMEQLELQQSFQQLNIGNIGLT